MLQGKKKKGASKEKEEAKENEESKEDEKMEEDQKEEKENAEDVHLVQIHIDFLGRGEEGRVYLKCGYMPTPQNITSTFNVLRL